VTGENRRLVVLGAPATQVQIKNEYFGSWRISLSPFYFQRGKKENADA